MDFNMIDLHTHTKYSDGTDTVIELLKNAENKGLKALSITDHNTCKAYDELKTLKIKDYYTGKIITGVELNTKMLNVPIEILGYNVDTDIMENLIKSTYVSQEDRNLFELKTLYEKCKLVGIELPDNYIEKYDQSCYVSRYTHQIIIKDEKNKKIIDDDAWNDIAVFYRKYMSNPTSLLFIDMDKLLPDFETTCNIVKKAGGLVFVPHIYQYRENSDRILDAILKLNIIDGIECYYTTFSKEQTDYLLNICKEKHLHVSGGSDYHGSFKPKVQLGIGYGDLKIPENILNTVNTFWLVHPKKWKIICDLFTLDRGNVGAAHTRPLELIW